MAKDHDEAARWLCHNPDFSFFGKEKTDDGYTAAAFDASNKLIERWLDHLGDCTAGMERGGGDAVKPRTKLASYIATRAVTLVLTSNQLEGTVPRGQTQVHVFRHLQELWFSGTRGNLPTETWDEDGDDEASNVAALLRSAGTSSRPAVESAEIECQHGRLLSQFADHIMALRYLWLNKSEISVEVCAQAHAILFQHCKSRIGGDWRNETPCHAHQKVFPESSDMKTELDALLKRHRDTNSKRHPIEQATSLMHAILELHPFRNGNGRLARLMFAVTLANSGLNWPVTYSHNTRKARHHYITALQRADRGDHKLLVAGGVFAVAASVADFCKCMST